MLTTGDQWTSYWSMQKRSSHRSTHWSQQRIESTGIDTGQGKINHRRGPSGLCANTSDAKAPKNEKIQPSMPNVKEKKLSVLHCKIESAKEKRWSKAKTLFSRFSPPVAT
jgi:hypothetical protein